MLSFVCSVGNVPLAAVLWSGGIGFAGVLAFLFADLIVLPIVLAYRKYYGWPFTVRIVALMFVTMVLAALAHRRPLQRPRPDPVRPEARRGRACSAASPSTTSCSSTWWGWPSSRRCSGSPASRGATDPVCGMRVDRDKALRRDAGGETLYFCSEHCLQEFDAAVRAPAGPAAENVLT